MERPYFRSVPHHHSDGVNGDGNGRWQPPSPAGAPSSTRHPGAESLPTDRIELGTQVAILRAFARLSDGGRPVRGEQIAGTLKIDADAASLSNGFFVESGWLERTGPDQYVATEAAIAFDHRIDSDDSTTAVEPLARTARSSWYWQTLSHNLDPGSLSRYDALVLLATVGNTAEEHRPLLETLLQWLEFLGLISTAGDRIVGARDLAVHDDIGSSPADDETASERPQPRPSGVESSGDVVLTFTTELRLTRDDLAALSPDQICALFDAIGAVASLTRRRR